MVTPIAITYVAWEQYLTQARALLNRSVTKSLDVLGQQPKTLSHFCDTLAEASGEEKEHELIHSSAVFLAEIDTDAYVYLLEKTDLNASRWHTGKNKTVGVILSANIQVWKWCIANNCYEWTPEDIRQLFNEVLIHLESAGFNWNEYKKIKHGDTFLLEEKR